MPPKDWWDGLDEEQKRAAEVQYRVRERLRVEQQEREEERKKREETQLAERAAREAEEQKKKKRNLVQFG